MLRGRAVVAQHRTGCHPLIRGRSPVYTLGSGEGAIAQLVERLHGMQEVSGSIPLSSTRIVKLANNNSSIKNAIMAYSAIMPKGNVHDHDTSSRDFTV